MALIRHAQLGEVVRDAVALDLTDLERRGQILVAEARAEATRIVGAAQTERDRLLAGASEEGYASGHAEGVERGRNEGRPTGAAEALADQTEALALLQTGWAEALERFETERAELISRAREDVVRLALAVARKVTGLALEDHAEETIDARLVEVLGLLTRPTALRLAVHPLDAETARGAIPALLARFEQAQHAEVLEDDTLERGSVVARTDSGGIIDASITTQLDRIASALVGRAPSSREEGDQGGDRA